MLGMYYQVEKSHGATDDAECFVLASRMVHPAQICPKMCKVLCQAQLADPCSRGGGRGVQGGGGLNHSAAATFTEMQ